MTRGVLVTGVTTPLGAALARALLARPGARVLGVGAEEAPRDLPADRRFRYQRVDLTRWRDLRGLLYGPARDLGLDALVHTATHRDPLAGGDPHALDVEATRELLRLGEHHPTLRRFVYRSFAEVYHVDGTQPTLLDEQDRLELDPAAPRWLRDRVEADLTVAACAGLSTLEVTVLRCADVFCAASGGQLHDFTRLPICPRPLGFDPMVELLSLDDAVRAILLALAGPAGVYNIPGRDVLPLSCLLSRLGRRSLPLPGALLGRLDRLLDRRHLGAFRYGISAGRLRWSGLLDGTRARQRLGYTPERSALGLPVAGGASVIRT